MPEFHFTRTPTVDLATDPFGGITGPYDSGKPCVYVIGWADSDYLKVGRTRDLPKRVRALQTGHPYLLTIERKVLCLCDDYERVEKYLHSELNDYAAPAKNEWFKRHPTLRCVDHLLGMEQAYRANIKPSSQTAEMKFEGSGKNIAKSFIHMEKTCSWWREASSEEKGALAWWLEENLLHLPDRDYFKNLYSQYEFWCKHKNLPPDSCQVSKIRFSKLLCEYGAKKIRRHGDMGWLFEV